MYSISDLQLLNSSNSLALFAQPKMPHIFLKYSLEMALSPLRPFPCRGTVKIAEKLRIHSHRNILHCVDWVNQGILIKYSIWLLFSLFLLSLLPSTSLHLPQYFKVNPSFPRDSCKSRQFSCATVPDPPPSQ